MSPGDARAKTETWLTVLMNTKQASMAGTVSSGMSVRIR